MKNIGWERKDNKNSINFKNRTILRIVLERSEWTSEKGVRKRDEGRMMVPII